MSLTVTRRPGGTLQLGTTKARRHAPGRRDWHPTLGRGELIYPDGSIAWEGDWEQNTLHDAGELSVLNTWLREQAHATKYLALLAQGSITALGETLTFTGVTEAETPGTDGYARQLVTAGDWAAPVLDTGDYATTAAQKTFGAVSAGTDWSVSHVAMTTASTGTAGGLFISIPLPSVQPVTVGVSFRYTMTTKAL